MHNNWATFRDIMSSVTSLVGEEFKIILDSCTTFARCNVVSRCHVLSYIMSSPLEPDTWHSLQNSIQHTTVPCGRQYDARQCDTAHDIARQCSILLLNFLIQTRQCDNTTYPVFKCHASYCGTSCRIVMHCIICHFKCRGQITTHNIQLSTNKIL